MPLLLVLLLAASSPLSPDDVGAQEREPEVILPACGISYPEGFDPNTVGTVEGRVVSFLRPEQGPVSFRIEAAGETYTVLAAPFWYWEARGIKVGIGDRVRVKGSKTVGADENLYLVVQEITVAGEGKPVVLRDALGKPSWSGFGQRGRGRRSR